MLFKSGYKVQQIISHPDYDTDSKDNDVALMKLETSLSFTGGYSALLKGKNPVAVSTPFNYSEFHQAILVDTGRTQNGPRDRV